MSQMKELMKLLELGKELTKEADAELRSWLASLDFLMKRVRTWLKEAEAKGLLEIVDEKIPMNDAKLGDFEVPGLNIKLARGTIWVRPIGRRTPVGEGRVDIWNANAAVTLVRFLDRDSVQWYVANESLHDKDWQPINEESFASILKSLIQP